MVLEVWLQLVAHWLSGLDITKFFQTSGAYITVHRTCHLKSHSAGPLWALYPDRAFVSDISY